MKSRQVLVRTLIMIAAVLFLTTSCAKQTVQSQAETTEPEAPVVHKVPEERTEPVEEPAPEVAENTIVNEKIYFGFDSAALSDQAPPILTDMVAYLRTNPGLSVTVQGHCDERGADTYNMKLGVRRAEAVKQFIVDHGIAAHRLVTMSYGEERPVAFGHNETSWAQNRRAEFVVN